MIKTSVVLAALAAIVSPGVSYAQTSTDTEASSPLSGSVAVFSNNDDYDGFVYNDEPTIKGEAFLDIGDGFAFDVYAFKGITQGLGDELDIGPSLTTEVAPGTELTLWLYRDFIRGESDLTEFGASIERGPVNVEVNYFVPDHGADALRLVVRYTLPSIHEDLECRGLGVYETGFDLGDIALVGAEASYALSDRWSIEARYLQPVIREAGDPRTNRFTIGARFNF